MTLVSSAAPLAWPGNHPFSAAISATNSIATMDAAGEYVGAVFVAREAMAISHIGFRPGSVVASGAADVRIETVDGTTGLPTGTLWAANTNATTGALTSNTWKLQALTATASISIGQAFAVLIQYSSGTSFIVNGVVGPCAHADLPYRVVNTGAAGKNISSTMPNMAVGSNATTFYPLRSTFPVASIGGGTFNNTNSAERALRFQVPFACRVVGLALYSADAAGDFNIIMRDDAGSELSSSSTAYDGNIIGNNTSFSSEHYFDNPVTLAANTWYRACVQPSSATNVNFHTLTLPSSDYRSALRGGANQHYATYTSGGGWVDTETQQVPVVDILIDQIDDGTGSGSGGGSRSRIQSGF
jgi:hypothetical protein